MAEDLKPESPQAKINAALLDESMRLWDALERGEMNVKEWLLATKPYEITLSAPEAIPIRDNLLTLIDEYLEYKISFGEFDNEFGRIFHKELPGWGLARDEAIPLGDVDDKLQWTVATGLTTEERSYGYRSTEEFYSWLVSYRAKLPRKME
jgi:hypothetical protein